MSENEVHADPAAGAEAQPEIDKVETEASVSVSALETAVAAIEIASEPTPQPKEEEIIIPIEKHNEIEPKKTYVPKEIHVVDPLLSVDPPTDSEPSPPPTAKPPPAPFSYRHYQPFHPCCNKILAMKWDKTLQKQHRNKVFAAKATVDNASPKPYIHLQKKLKKVQMEQGNVLKLEYESRRHLIAN